MDLQMVGVWSSEFASQVADTRNALRQALILARQYRRDSRGRFGSGGGDAVTGQDALDAVPAEYLAEPGGHFGTYSGELTGPPGMGSQQALAEYEGPEYQTTNQHLRGGYREGYVPEGVPERVVEIDKTMAVSRSTSDVVVERGVANGDQMFGSDTWHGDVVDWDDFDHGTDRWEAGERPNLTGAKWQEKAYVSTSAQAGTADAFVERQVRFQRETSHVGLQGEPVVMRISVPAGTGAVQLGRMGEVGPKGPTTSAEILLERGLTMQVTADHGVDEGGIRRLDVEVVDD